MKVLLRYYDNECLVWKKANRVKDSIWEVDGQNIHENDIISVEGKIPEMVKCSYCGEIMKNDPDIIEKHRHRSESPESCLKCRHLTERARSRLGIIYHKQGDGKYIKTERTKCSLVCTAGYGYRDIDSQEARDGCGFARCRDAEIREIKSFFEKYPDAFDELATVDGVVKNGFEIVASYDDKIEKYNLKCRNHITVTAYSGIILEFHVEYRNYSWNLMYSKKYGKLFMMSGNSYEEWDGINWGIPSSTIENITKKIASLYN